MDRLTTQTADVTHLWGCGLGLKQGVKGMACCWQILWEAASEFSVQDVYREVLSEEGEEEDQRLSGDLS